MAPSATPSTQRTLAANGVARCWQSLDNAKITNTMKEEARKHGIPASLRAEAYYVLSGGSALQTGHPPRAYSALAASTADISDTDVYAVEADITSARVFFTTSAKGAEALSRIIFAFVNRNPRGYFRALPQIAGLLLTVFGREREEQAFWTLVALLEKRFLPHCGGQVQWAARVEVATLQQLLEQRQPALAALLAKLGPDALEQLCCSWFSAAFTKTLPSEVVLRVWDCCVVEGPKVALRVAMALIKLSASSIQSCTNIDVLSRVMEARFARYNDAEALLAVAFKGVGSLSGACVEAARLRVLAEMPDCRRSTSGPPAPAGPSSGGGASSGSTGSITGRFTRNSPLWPSLKSTGALLSLA
ncbi:Growth hormone-regulated TBC protein 1 [Tetrabaena socialis]|uniref:Growth hormone-regulated TBC protein 1 n=1 Tax=Tetrabaena socialis TaxID=47790 RepID=A0A2J8AHH5_9CHLO|nr:Growth hormone-regulated TBC protein 1 [Tetrabaena socialis]|eukprot:PNH11967.1 Growth hormone-regulated TBC protein 1 [Tetrabaena socialis]